MEENFQTPAEHDAEKASNSYIMSLLSVVVGLPLPVVNLLTTLIFYLGNRKSGKFVKWHCTQALLSQSSLLIVNTALTVWSILLLLDKTALSNNYIAYLISVLIFNFWEFVGTIDAAIKTRKGMHVEWFFFGSLTNLIIKRK